MPTLPDRDAGLFSAETGSLASLEAAVRRDFARINHPPANWPLPVTGPDGAPVLDVLVVGAGQFGQTAAFALLRDGVRNIRVVDRAARGQEGPWATTARMLTLRSPKHLTGPDLGIPALTFRAWYEAQHGAAGWESLYKIDRLQWVDYLLWVREMAAIPVENDTALLSLEPAGGSLRGADGAEQTVFARQVVLASGRDGNGGVRRPVFPSLPADQSGAVFHSNDAIDFERFRDRRVAVLGASASAFDNAGAALEAGASVTLFCRRPHLPQVNRSRGLVFAGYLHGFARLDDARRWDWLTLTSDTATPPPHESVLRCERHAGFSLRFGVAWHDVSADRDGVTVLTDSVPLRFDAAILGTGFAMDLARQPELAAFHDHALLWRDQVPANAAASYPDLAGHPYLAEGFALTERAPGCCPELGRVRMFGAAAAVSYGILAGDIPALATGALRLARSITDALFIEDADRHRAAMMVFEEPELRPTSYYVPPEQRRGRVV